MHSKGKTRLGVAAASCAAVLWGMVTASLAGPYSAAMNDPGNPHDAPVPGFVGPHGTGKARLDSFNVDENGDPIFENPDNFVNPLFFAWAETVTDYQRADTDAAFSDAELALGPVTGDNFDVVALGDLDAAAITAGTPPGTITVELARPIRDLTGADFVVFENGHFAQSNQGGAGIGGLFAELAHVWVSSNGEDFVRFPSISLTPTPAGMYGSLDPTRLHNLAGKHTNAYGNSWGTPFDLAQVGLSQITHIRLVDIPGSGAFADDAGRPIYDPWRTFGSGGFDLEAVGAISTTMTYNDWPALTNLPAASSGKADDPDGDGLPNLLEYAFARIPWLADAAGAQPQLRWVTVGDGLLPELVFIRDERLTDLTYDVQVADSLTENGWTTIARSIAGGVVEALSGHPLLVTESSASPISSVGVIRQVTVRDTGPASERRFFRVKVTSNIP